MRDCKVENGKYAEVERQLTVIFKLVTVINNSITKICEERKGM